MGTIIGTGGTKIKELRKVSNRMHGGVCVCLFICCVCSSVVFEFMTCLCVCPCLFSV